MKKKHTLMNYLAAAICGLTALLGAGCTADDGFGRLPQGSIPLDVGSVIVAGMSTSTRADIFENAAGYTGIRKSSFVDSDRLTLTLSNDGGTTNTTLIATLTGGAWVLSGKAYVIPGTTTIEAAYAGSEVAAGIKPDALKADTYTLDGQKVTFAMKHAHAMIDITLPRNSIPAGVTITSITVAAHNGTANETLATVKETERSEVDLDHYRTIALPGTVKSFTAVINGQSYVATLATPLVLEANKKYPISLTFKENRLTATVGTAALNWGVGENIGGIPAGYTRIIDSPEALAQFAKDVNDDATATGACLLNVLQTADIDLSQLKPAAEAGINPLTGTAYTYTATADAWTTPIGTYTWNASLHDYNLFMGSYNGNGHTISNMKITKSDANENFVGFFGGVKDGTLTGIHLRNVQADISQSERLYIGALVSIVKGTSTVTLCSATGSLKAKVTGGSTNQFVEMGGLIYSIEDYASVTRCSADVDVQAEAAGGVRIGGFACVGYGTDVIIAGCSSTGTVSYTSPDNKAGGFLAYITDCNATTIADCYCSGTLKDNTGYSFVGNLTDAATISVTLSGCYSTSASLTGGNLDFTSFYDVYDASFHHITDCASTATQITGIPGITGSVAVADLYATVTASNASLADVRTLHWSTAEGYTLTPVTNAWYATDVWKDNGTAAPTLDLTHEGWDGKYEGQTPNLLEIAGKTAYYVAPVDAHAGIVWGNINFNTICPEGWHVPTAQEFSAMTGFAMDDAFHSENYAKIAAVFPPAQYWSSTEYVSNTEKAWNLTVNEAATGTVGVRWNTKRTSAYHVRCVRKK